MSDESQSLHADIRAGLRPCRCPRNVPEEREDYHLAGCLWMNAIRRIYEIERAEDARVK